MNSLTVIILTYNESIHISRCIATLKSLDARLLVVDSYSTDGTQDICRSLGIEVYENPFVNQAQQFQWAMDHCNVDSEWVLRLDADEVIDDELVRNIQDFILNDGYGHNGAIFHRKHIFLGKWIKHGGRYPLPMLRLFRKGFAHIEQRWMDEHIVLSEGKTILISTHNPELLKKYKGNTQDIYHLHLVDGYLNDITNESVHTKEANSNDAPELKSEQKPIPNQTKRKTTKKAVKTPPIHLEKKVSKGA